MRTQSRTQGTLISLMGSDGCWWVEWGAGMERGGAGGARGARVNGPVNVRALPCLDVGCALMGVQTYPDQSI